MRQRLNVKRDNINKKFKYQGAKVEFLFVSALPIQSMNKKSRNRQADRERAR
jgi:hypothetical protein